MHPKLYWKSNRAKALSRHCSTYSNLLAIRIAFESLENVGTVIRKDVFPFSAIRSLRSLSAWGKVKLLALGLVIISANATLHRIVVTGVLSRGIPKGLGLPISPRGLSKTIPLKRKVSKKRNTPAWILCMMEITCLGTVRTAMMRSRRISCENIVLINRLLRGCPTLKHKRTITQMLIRAIPHHSRGSNIYHRPRRFWVRLERNSELTCSENMQVNSRNPYRGSLVPDTTFARRKDYRI